MTFPVKKIFQMIDQKRFAEVSGDWNPMHKDPLVARRTQMGVPVVHGMHALLLCLDFYAQTPADLNPISAMNANFLNPIYAGDQVEFEVLRLNPLCLAASVKGIKVLTIEITFSSRTKSGIIKLSTAKKNQKKKKPVELSFKDIEASYGVKKQITMSAAAMKMFPNASHWLGSQTVQALAALSRIVGMECPGLHSIFLGFSINLITEDSDNQMEFSVLSTDYRFKRVKLGVVGGGVNGVVEAAMRVPPVLQPSLRKIAAKIKARSFANQRVLIIGGSRGIGEYVGKVIAAGGGHVTLTYKSGIVEARALLNEIREYGGKADIMAYDVGLPAAAQLKRLKKIPTHVYYFATCPIFRRRTNEFDLPAYAEFQQFYVTGFYELCSALRKMTQRVSVFYPSSAAVALEGRPKGITEYAMAKAAGEILCTDMRWIVPGVEVTVKRLPRLLTDQTATIRPVAREKSMNVLLPVIFKMQRPVD
jgi:acyl dehydratase